MQASWLVDTFETASSLRYALRLRLTLSLPFFAIESRLPFMLICLLDPLETCGIYLEVEHDFV
jgi:hypothetical protein